VSEGFTIKSCALTNRRRLDTVSRGITVTIRASVAPPANQSQPVHRRRKYVTALEPVNSSSKSHDGLRCGGRVSFENRYV